jgi:hypothetical protein
LVLEALEARQVLASFSYAIPKHDGPDDVTLGYNGATKSYEIRDSLNPDVLLASRKAGGGLSDIKVTGKVEPDTLRIAPSFLANPLPVKFDGGAGVLDTIIAAADANMTLTTSLLTISPTGLPVTKVTLVRIELVMLTGGAGNNTLDASGFASPLGTGSAA